MTRRGSDNTKELTADVITDLRTDDRLLETLGDGNEPGDPTERIRTPLTAPSPDNIPPALVVVDVQAVGSMSMGRPTSVDYEIEAGLTITAGWIEGDRPGPSADLAFSDILDAISERAAVSFGVDHLAQVDSGSGGSGVLDSPMDAGERAAARVFAFTQSRN
ncbi:hypothetical protein [Halostagnicola sp. A-GB9-2]|uniref:hypothetical protein n=1 Tax=Halostagnicola sp. A-GB9-2 TaxID=3048066 RepID=UPI0024BF536B|nr:hypothetical protein [Halostagnicola sp. A-GB9-2]MDJ1433590.1 hypothetical protein [Halostagnicola sp. A-GB9-2]